MNPRTHKIRAREFLLLVQQFAVNRSQKNCDQSRAARAFPSQNTGRTVPVTRPPKRGCKKNKRFEVLCSNAWRAMIAKKV